MVSEVLKEIGRSISIRQLNKWCKVCRKRAVMLWVPAVVGRVGRGGKQDK